PRSASTSSYSRTIGVAFHYKREPWQSDVENRKFTMEPRFRYYRTGNTPTQDLDASSIAL
ncbi:MAG TPA: hypothetical protein VFK47_16535, partial [Ktedonobacteraceae bacterium]|nr:hypothetical protein [Ktedonobacteraceae bacterium]